MTTTQADRLGTDPGSWFWCCCLITLALIGMHGDAVA
jgi:hypothetical protein